MFEHGKLQYPVWLGMMYGVNKEEALKGRSPNVGTPGKKNTFKPYGARIPSAQKIRSRNTKTFVSPVGPVAPEESYETRSTAAPTTHVIFKSPKGHTIYAVDEDEGERLCVVDRLGQKIELYCPVKESDNVRNRAYRGTTEAKAGEALDLSRTPNNTSSISVTDAHGQVVQLRANAEGKSAITVASPNSGYVTIEEDGKKITLHSFDESTVTIDKNLKAVTDGTTLLDSKKEVTVKTKASLTVNADQSITISNAAGSSVMIDTSGNITLSAIGALSISAAAAISISAPGVTIN